MSTLRDTDEGRARPSVWPVYVVAGIIGAVSLLVLRFELVLSWKTQGPFAGLLILFPWTIYVFFGLLTAWGLLRLRVWGWWCAVVWTIGFAAATGFTQPSRDILLEATGLTRFDHIATMSRLPLVLWVATIALLVWPLATRRRLFLPGQWLRVLWRRMLHSIVRPAYLTAEGRAGPSVWPVYVIAAAIGLPGLGLGILLFGGGVLGVGGVFSILTAYGLLRLRPWGWWCGIIWMGTSWLVIVGVVMVSRMIDISLHVQGDPSVLVIGLIWSAIIGVAVWILATRRRLFFPPRQAGRE